MSRALYVSTVLTLMARSDEISLFDLPSATNRTTSCSRAVKIVRQGRSMLEALSCVAQGALLDRLEVEKPGIGGEGTSIAKHPTCATRPRLSSRGKRFSIKWTTPDRLGNRPVTCRLDNCFPDAKTLSQRGTTFSAIFPRISWNVWPRCPSTGMRCILATLSFRAL